MNYFLYLWNNVHTCQGGFPVFVSENVRFMCEGVEEEERWLKSWICKNIALICKEQKWNKIQFDPLNKLTQIYIHFGVVNVELCSFHAKEGDFFIKIFGKKGWFKDLGFREWKLENIILAPRVS